MPFGYGKHLQNEAKDHHSVVFKLTKQNHKSILPTVISTNELAKTTLQIQKGRNAVIAIRQSKLPDPKNWETAVAFKTNTFKTDFEKYISNFLK
jgi:hypothetical protein